MPYYIGSHAENLNGMYRKDKVLSHFILRVLSYIDNTFHWLHTETNRLVNK